MRNRKGRSHRSEDTNGSSRARQSFAGKGEGTGERVAWLNKDRVRSPRIPAAARRPDPDGVRRLAGRAASAGVAEVRQRGSLHVRLEPVADPRRVPDRRPAGDRQRTGRANHPPTLRRASQLAAPGRGRRVAADRRPLQHRCLGEAARTQPVGLVDPRPVRVAQPPFRWRPDQPAVGCVRVVPRRDAAPGGLTADGAMPPTGIPARATVGRRRHATP